MSCMSTELLAAPAPTDDLDRAKADFDETGIGIVRGALDDDRLALVRDVLYRTAATDRQRGRALPYDGDGPGPSIQGVVNLPSRDPVFLDLVEHPIALDFVRHAIGWPALLSNISAIITGPGNTPQVLHADMSYMPEPWGGLQGVNCIWCIDDFTEERGATRVVPGSHRQNTKYRDQDVETVPLLAPAGAMVALDGRVWHGTAANTTTDQLRAGIFGWYTKPIYLPQENWWLTLDQSIRTYGSEDLKVLFGYKILAGFGLAFGRSPE